MRWRYLPPAYSPLTLEAVVAGLVPPKDARDTVAKLVEREYSPRGLLLTDSGTSALRLALEAVAAQRGGRVALIAMPAWCCYDVATAADGADLPVVLYDLDPNTLCPEPGSLHRAISAGAEAVVIAHLYGLPVDIASVAESAGRAGAILIEDAAQGQGGSYLGRPLGAHGLLSVLSFGRGKGRTGGQGGALLANDDRGSHLLTAARNRIAPPQRRAKEPLSLLGQWALGRPGWYRAPASIPFLGLGETRYREPSLPRELDRGSAASLAHTWPLAGAEVEARQRNAAAIGVLLEGRSRIRPITPPEQGVAGFLRFPALFPEGAIDRAARALGIMPGYPMALPDLPGFGARCVNAGDPFPGARELARRLGTFPTHSMLREADLAALARWITSKVSA